MSFTFIQELAESKLFKSKSDLPSETTFSGLTDSFFASMLALKLMTLIDKDNAQFYIKKTLQYDNLANWRSSGSDLHNLAHILCFPDSYKNKIKIDKFIHFPKSHFKKLLEELLLSDGDTLKYFFKLQKNLNIRNPKLTAIRRNLEIWDTLDNNTKKKTANKLYLLLRPSMAQSDLWVYFHRALKRNKIIDRELDDIKDKSPFWFKMINS